MNHFNDSIKLEHKLLYNYFLFINLISKPNNLKKKKICVEYEKY